MCFIQVKQQLLLGASALRSPHTCEFEIHIHVFGLRETYIRAAYLNQLDEDMKKMKIGLISLAMVLLFAFPAVTSVMAYSGSIACLTPASCATSDTVSLNGPGSSATLTVWLYGSTAPAGATIYYFVCPQTASTCTTATGTGPQTDPTTGWQWNFTPVSGQTASGSPCASSSSCEGNGLGNPSTMSLTVTAPTGSLATTYPTELLTIYACSLTGTSYTCNSEYQTVATLTITAAVPQFALGLGLAMTIGLVGLVLVKKRSTSKIAGTAATAAAA